MGSTAIDIGLELCRAVLKAYTEETGLLAHACMHVLIYGSKQQIASVLGPGAPRSPISLCIHRYILYS